MSFSRYPKYRPSGVEWLRSIPEHWALLRVGNLFDEIRNKVSDREFPALSVTKNGVVPQLETAAKTDDGDNRKQVLKGDLVINSRSDRKGSAGVSDLEGSVSLICTVLRPRSELYRPYVHHLMRSVAFQEEFYRNGKGIVADLWSTGYSEMKNILLAVPPIEEQRAIANLLSRETAKIDALIAEQERLIELLKEKRQAVISQAVTKGLNAQAQMRPSGIGWLGEIPKEWEIKRLKHISPSLTVGIVVNPSEYISSDGLPYIYGADIREGAIDWERSRRIDSAVSEAQAKTRLCAGDLLTVRVGAPGVTAVVPPECQGGNCASVMLVRRGRFDSRWLCYAMNARIVRYQVEVVQYGAAQEQFNISHAVNFWLPVPPDEKQAQIADYLDEETRRIDELFASASACIDLYRERRSALISAAVTGQIDVRSVAEQKAA